MDQLIVNNYLSFFIAIILLLLIHNFSDLVSKKNTFIKNKIFNYVVSANLVLIGLSLIIFFLFLFELKIDLIRISLLILFLFIFFKNRFDFNKLLIFNKFEYLFILFFFILALCPPSDADSLDYHLGFAVSAIENNSILPRNDWFHYRLFGYGEYLNLFGFIFFSKHFGQLVNFYSFFLICLIFKEFTNERKLNLNLIFYFLSTPLLIWLVYSSKPQLLLSQIILLVFILILKQQIFRNIYIINIFLCFVIVCKISFIYSAGFLTIYLFYTSIKEDFFLRYLKSGILALLLILLPIFILKFSFYGDIHPPMFEKFKKVNDPAILEFLFTISKDSATFIQIKPFYFLILPIIATIPFSTKILTTILGFGYNTLYLYPFLKKETKEKKYLFLQFIFVVTSIIFFSFQNNFQPRYLLDSFLVNGLLFSILLNKTKIFRILNVGFYIASFFILIILIPISIFYFSANFNNDSYEKIMNKIANNYSEIQWIEKNIDKDDIVSSQTSRSHALMNFNFITRERTFQFHPVFRAKEREKYFGNDFINLKDLYQKYNISKLVVRSDQTQDEFVKFLIECTNFGKTDKKKTFYSATRNPISSLRKNNYELQIVENKCLKRD